MTLPFPFQEYTGRRKVLLRAILKARQEGVSSKDIAAELRVPQREVEDIVRISPASVPLNTYESAQKMLKLRRGGQYSISKLCASDAQRYYFSERYPGMGNLRPEVGLGTNDILRMLNDFGLSPKEVLCKLKKEDRSLLRARVILEHMVRENEDGLWEEDLIEDLDTLHEIQEMACEQGMQIDEIAEKLGTVSWRIAESMTRAIDRLGPYVTSPSFHP